MSSISEEKEKIEEVAQNLDVESLKQNKALDAFLILLVLFLTFSMFYFGLENSSLLERGQGMPENDSVEADPVPTVEYELRSQGIFPYQHTVTDEAEVYMVNSMDQTVRVTFDRYVDDFELEPGERREVETGRITYFQVNDPDTSERIGRGKINVQTS